MDLNQDLPRVNKQDDIFTAYDRRHAPEQPVAVGKIESEGGELEFSQYETPKLEVRKAEQDEIEPQQAQEAPGLEAFNITNLLSKEMWDIAEYFLGRKLTSEEKMSGMIGKAEAETIRKQSRDTEVLESLARLVAAIPAAGPAPAPAPAPAPVLPRAQAEHKDSDDDDDGDDTTFISFAQSAPPIEESLMAPSKKDPNKTELEVRVDEIMSQIEDLDEEEENPLSLPDRAPYLGEEELVEKGLLAAPAKPAIYDPKETYTGEKLKQIIRDLRTANAELYSQWESQTKKQSKAEKDKSRPLLWMPYSGMSAEQLRLHMDKVWQDLNVRQQQLEEAKKAGPASAPVKKGRGVRPDNVRAEEPREEVKKREYKKRELVPFGPKWLVDPLALKEGNELIILRQTDRGHMNKHPNRIVSAAMKVCLLAFLAGQPMPTELLNADEKEFLQWMMEDGKMAFKQKQQTPLTIKRTPKQIKDRLSILYGEIAEGPNDNPDVKREFKNLYNQASLMGLLSVPQIENLQEFIKTF